VMRPGDRSHDRAGQGRAPRRVPKREQHTHRAHARVPLVHPPPGCPFADASVSLFRHSRDVAPRCSQRDSLLSDHRIVEAIDRASRGIACEARANQHRPQPKWNCEIILLISRIAGDGHCFRRDAGQTKRSRFLRLVLAPRSRYRAPLCHRNAVTTLAALLGHDKIINRGFQLSTRSIKGDESRVESVKPGIIASPRSECFAKCILRDPIDVQ